MSMRTLSYVIPFSNLNLFVQFLSLRVSSNFQTQHSVHTIIHTTYSNIHTIPLCLTLCGILCLRENPDCKSHANTEGKGWKKAPPVREAHASLNTEAHQSTLVLLWEVLQCQELEAEELLTFPIICTFCQSDIYASLSVIVKCGRAGRVKTDF